MNDPLGCVIGCTCTHQFKKKGLIAHNDFVEIRLKRHIAPINWNSQKPIRYLVPIERNSHRCFWLQWLFYEQRSILQYLVITAIVNFAKKNWLEEKNTLLLPIKQAWKRRWTVIIRYYKHAETTHWSKLENYLQKNTLKLKFLK